MNITDVRVRKVNDEGKMKAVVSITFDEEFVVHDIKVIEGQNGLFIAMPSRKMGEGDFRDIAHPLRSETRNKIKEAIFVEYEKILENANATQVGSSTHQEVITTEKDHVDALEDAVDKEEDDDEDEVLEEDSPEEDDEDEDEDDEEDSHEEDDDEDEEDEE